ncbi:MAG: hypothetical protein U0236_14265 [Nitrospira sp.]
MISTGFACALVSADIGVLLVGHEVVSRGWEGAESLQAIGVSGEERDHGHMYPRNSTGRTYGAVCLNCAVIGSAMEKRAVAEKTEAIGLDMESAALAVEANRTHTPFIIIRTASISLTKIFRLTSISFSGPLGGLKGSRVFWLPHRASWG